MKPEQILNFLNHVKKCSYSFMKCKMYIWQNDILSLFWKMFLEFRKLFALKNIRYFYKKSDFFKKYFKGFKK